MDNIRLFLFVAIAFVLLFIWQAWQQDFGPAPEPVAEAPNRDGTAAPDAASVPSVPGTDATQPPAAAQRLLAQGQRIHVRTDVLDVVIDTRGGDLRRVELPAYPVDVDRPEQPFRLMDDAYPHVFVAQSGLLSDGAPSPTHREIYRAEAGEYRLGAGEDVLRVPLTWTSPDGLEVTKTYVFERNSYAVRVEHRVTNNTGAPWRGRPYAQFQRTETDNTEKNRLLYTYTGGVIYSDVEGYEKIAFEDMRGQPLSRTVADGWLAMIQHYFLGAWVPAEGAHLYSKVLNEGPLYILGAVSPERTVQPGATDVFAETLYVGPKEQERLAAVAPGLELTVDYGILTFLSQPLFWLLDKLHALLGNWGWAIVALVILIKAAFYKLSETSYRSMARMRRIQPRLQSLKERYGDDRQGFNQAMMKLYKEEKVNPLGGCLPMLVQIPVFIALYWVLLESVELRQAPFILWIDDLSQRDPYFVLPLLMGVSMFVQQRLSPAALDPIQQKVMMVMPVIFTVFFAFFPAGLVLYWVVNNSLSILQQWWITRRMEAAPAKA